MHGLRGGLRDKILSLMVSNSSGEHVYDDELQLCPRNFFKFLSHQFNFDDLVNDFSRKKTGEVFA